LFFKLKESQSSEKKRAIGRPQSQSNSNIPVVKRAVKKSPETPITFEACDTGASVEEYEETCNTTNYASNQYLSTQNNEMRSSSSWHARGDITRSNSSHFSSKGQDINYFRSPVNKEETHQRIKLNFVDEEELKH
jgi:hypothetical protein